MALLRAKKDLRHLGVLKGDLYEIADPKTLRHHLAAHRGELVEPEDVAIKVPEVKASIPRRKDGGPAKSPNVGPEVIKDTEEDDGEATIVTYRHRGGGMYDILENGVVVTSVRGKEAAAQEVDDRS